PTPVTGPHSMSAGTPAGTPSGSPFAGGGNAQVSQSNATRTTEDALIKLITSTVEPRSWDNMGGPGSIDYYPLTMALVVSQTPDIQEQIADLLAALRRLQ